MGPEAFLEPLGMSGLWPCAHIYQKRASCHNCPVGGAYDKYRHTPSRVEHMHYSLGGTGLEHTLVSCVGRYMDLVGCVLVPVAVSRDMP